MDRIYRGVADDYRFWAAKLAGLDPDPPDDRTVMPLGFFRTSHNEPLACWLEGGKRVATLDGKPMTEKNMERIAEMGGFGKAVQEDAWRFRTEKGHWPDDPPALPGIGDNSQTGDAFEDLRAELAGEEETTAEFLAKPIETQEDADRVGTWARRIIQLKGRAVDAHDVEKAPVLVAGKEIDDKWRPLVDGAVTLAKRLKDHVEAFLVEQKRRRQEEQRKAEAAAAELRRKAADEGRRTAAERDALNQRAAETEKKAAEPGRSTAGRTGYKVGLTMERRGIITDYHAAFLACENHLDIKELVAKIAQRAAKAGIAMAGVTIEEVERVR